MSRFILAGAAALALIATPLMAQAQAAAPASAPAAASAKLSSKSGIKDLLANPQSKEVLTKYIPIIVQFLDSGQAEAIVPGTTPLATLAENPQAAQAGLTPEVVKKIDEDLAKL